MAKKDQLKGDAKLLRSCDAAITAIQNKIAERRRELTVLEKTLPTLLTEREQVEARLKSCRRAHHQPKT